ncbi:uncharacterized protein LOC110937403 [Helianthus annuus]|uniref:uncharacterized protein LOC110937403 n=1 Tax=Helianthus annuus TaxID=4232 RepID=UPI000B904939|nr:uncharacterized protein LOC110937403 [Helianthus annuus]
MDADDNDSGASNDSTISQQSINDLAPPNSPANQDVILLTDIEDFMDDYGVNPMYNGDHLEAFFNGWSERGVRFKDSMEVLERLEDLRDTFLMNFKRENQGENVEDEMDVHQRELYRLSKGIWGGNDDQGVDMEEDEGVDMEEDEGVDMEVPHPLNPHAPPFYPSRFHHVNQRPPPVTNTGNQKVVRYYSLTPVPTGPRNRLCGFTRRRGIQPVGRKVREVIPLNPDEHSTSVMIRNIPNNYTRSLLVEFLENHCKHENEKAGNTIRSAFDFVYLPVDFKHRLNAGYAFVNFTTSEAARRFHVSVKGKKWDLFRSKKIADVSRARIQGKDALVKNFERMRLCSPSWEYLPVWFEPPRDGCMMGSSSKMHTVGEVQVGR